MSGGAGGEVGVLESSRIEVLKDEADRRKKDRTFV